MAVANTLAYCDTTTFTAVKSFIVQDPSFNAENLFFFVTNAPDK